jgi:hypothetical protein
MWIIFDSYRNVYVLEEPSKIHSTLGSCEYIGAGRKFQSGGMHANIFG